LLRRSRGRLWIIIFHGKALPNAQPGSASGDAVFQNNVITIGHKMTRGDRQALSGGALVPIRRIRLSAGNFQQANRRPRPLDRRVSPLVSVKKGCHRKDWEIWVSVAFPLSICRDPPDGECFQTPPAGRPGDYRNKASSIKSPGKTLKLNALK